MNPAAVKQRIPCLMAHRFEKLIRDGEVWDLADLARLGHVTRARLSQIMDLLNLGPNIQGKILFMEPVTEGDDPVRERQLRGIVAVADWGESGRGWCSYRYTRWQTSSDRARNFSRSRLWDRISQILGARQENCNKPLAVPI